VVSVDWMEEPTASELFKAELDGRARYCTMTVTMPFALAADPRSEENLADATLTTPAYADTAESTSSTSPRTRPQEALGARELSGRLVRPFVFCD